MNVAKPRLSLRQIIHMNVGFFGLQYSFGLQQSNMSPIYSYLGAEESTLPWLWLAGPMTGLLVQPFIGAMSDRTVTRWGRRRPYFLIGAIICSFALLIMPFSPTLWFAASLLWILDAANNVTMEPYRAFVADKLDESQRSAGFLTQSAFTGLGQTLSYLTPTIFVWLGLNQDAVNSHQIPYITIAAFILGALLSAVTMGWTLWTTPEIPLPEAELNALRQRPRSFRATFAEIIDAFKNMPSTMRQLAWVKLFQWYALFCYWQYIVLSLSKNLFATTDANTAGFREASLVNGQIGSFYNFVAFLAAFALIPVTRKVGAKWTHAVCLTAAAIGMIALSSATATGWSLYLPMLGIGLAWASIMGNPYVMLANSIPAEKTGVYMGIFNMFIVIPMMIQIFTLPLYYETLLGGDPRNVIRLAGGLMFLAALATLRVRSVTSTPSQIKPR